MGRSWAEAWGLFFYCEGGTRRNGAQTDERAGVENEAQGLKPGERKTGHRLYSRRNPEGFLRSGRLKSCFGEHDFSLLFSLPGLKPLRSVFQSPCTLIRLHPVPALGAGRGEGFDGFWVWEGDFCVVGGESTAGERLR